MEDAVDLYLSSRPTVFPIARNRDRIVLKSQKSYRSGGELITVAIQQQSFTVVSESLEESAQLLAWGKNKENVNALASCFKSQVREMLCVAA